MSVSHVAVLLIVLMMSFVSPAAAQQPAVDRTEAGRILLGRKESMG